MCGIAGYWQFGKEREENWPEMLSRMGKTMAHRGPDDHGEWFDEESGIGLAHRRLSIIDLSEEGRQPMTSPSGRYVITYNGEVYNFMEIRKSLQGENIEWRGHSDTEVMLAAMDTWGIDKSVRRFIGMFAFAVWDRKEKCLYLCRDRLGIKPLFYTRMKNCFIFGSELKPIMAHWDFRPSINRQALALYFRRNYIPSPYSIFQDTWKLPPGCILRIPEDAIQNFSVPIPRAYWKAEEIIESGQSSLLLKNLMEASEQLESLLRDAVKLRMISDVPLGAFLSGGIDSSTIAALMQLQSGQKIRTFSIGFRERGYNEADHAKAVAEHLGAEHTELYVTPHEAMQVIPELPVLYDEPFSDSSQIPTFLLSKMTREYVTVSLSGDGGDELFGGYNRYFWGRNIWKMIGWMPISCRKTAAKRLKKISPASWDAMAYKLLSFLPARYQLDMPGDRVHKLADIVATDSPEVMYHLLVSHWKTPGDIVIGGEEPPTILDATEKHPLFEDFVDRMMYLDLITYLPDDILTKVDRASMGVGLEARVPMIDHRVVEFAWRLPLSMKVRGSRGKLILRKVLDRYVPNELIERPKTGFGVPIDSWLRGPLREWAESLLSRDRLESEGFLNPAPVLEKWMEHQSGKRNWQYHLWDVLMFQAWKERYRL